MVAGGDCGFAGFTMFVFVFLFRWLGGGGVAAMGVGNGFVGGVKDHRLPDNPLSLWVFTTGRK